MVRATDKTFNLKNEIRILCGILAFILLLWFFFTLITSKLLPYLFDVFSRNLGSFIADSLKGVVGGTLFFSLLLFFFFVFLSLAIYGKISFYPKNIFWVGLFFTLFVLVSVGGIFFIDTIVGAQEVSWYLVDTSNNHIWGNVTCVNELTNDKILYTNSTAKCKFNTNWDTELNLFRVSSAVEGFYKEGGSFTNNTFGKELIFYIPKETKYLAFQLGGIPPNNKNTDIVSIYSSNPYKTFTIQGYEENKKTFISYLLGLAGLIFITLASLVINLRNLFTKS